MKNVQHALDVIGQSIKVKDLTLDSNQQAAIDMSRTVTIYLTALDDTQVELSCLLANLDYPDSAMMQAMLEANFLGAAVDHARLALDADKSEVILCERWSVAGMDAKTVEDRFNAFAVLAGFWLTDGTQSLMEQADAIRETMRPEPDDASAESPDGDGDPVLIMRL